MPAEKLSPRERVLCALNHKEPDRVPFDMSGTFTSGISKGAYEKLKKYMGIDRPTKYLNVRSQTALPDEEVLKKFHIDTRILLPISAAQEPSSLTDTYVDEWGVERKKLEGKPYYVSKPAFVGNISISDVEHHKWPDPYKSSAYQGMRKRAEKLRAETDCAIILYLPGRVISMGEAMLGFDVFLMDMISDPSLVEAILAKCTEIQLIMIENFLQEAGDLVDIVNVCDDLGMQTGLLFSTDLYRKMIKPWQKKIFEAIHSWTSAKLFYHSCGSVYDLIPDFIDIGVDILNPIQVSAAKMDPEQLKRQFGRDICFWGGIDTHQVMPFGTPDDVRREVRKRIDQVASGGGYVLNAVHNLQPEVPPENICTMFDAALEYGWY